MQFRLCADMNVNMDLGVARSLDEYFCTMNKIIYIYDQKGF